VEIILNTVEEIAPKDAGRRIFTLHTDFLHVNILALNRNEILIFLTEETWDLTSGKHRVDSFQEGLLLDFSVGHQEANRLSLRSSSLVKELDIIEEIHQII